MPVENQISIEITAAELIQMDEALTTLENIFKDKAVQLTPDEGNKYGKLGEETENWVKVIYTDTETAPHLVPDFVDWAEWTKDEKVSDVLSPRVIRLESITQRIVDTNRVVGFDIFQACRTVYNNTKYLSTQNVPGAKTYYEKWKARFSKTKNGKKDQDKNS